jgi:transposase InsO family protein
MVGCVIYAAKSSEDARGSIGTQLADCREAIRALGDREVESEFVDEAVSAFRHSRGTGLADAMMAAADIAEGEGGAELWVQHSDRLARGDGKRARHVVEIALWAMKVGVTVRTVEDPDTFRDLLYAVVMGQRNFEDSKRKGATVSAGKRRAAVRGEYGGIPLDGYRVAVDVNDAGAIHKRMEIDPDRAPLFELIFCRGLAGEHPLDIAREVNTAGWRTVSTRRNPQSVPFSANRIRTVLGNPRYAGFATYKGDIVGLAQWPAYISADQHRLLTEGRRKRPRGPTVNRREPFLLAGIAVSMGSRGDAYDNAVAESFFATLKKELVHRQTWPTCRELGAAVFEYIEGFYNRARRHSTLGYLSPEEFEKGRMTTVNQS